MVSLIAMAITARTQRHEFRRTSQVESRTQPSTGRKIAITLIVLGTVKTATPNSERHSQLTA